MQYSIYLCLSPKHTLLQVHNDKDDDSGVCVKGIFEVVEEI